MSAYELKTLFYELNKTEPRAILAALLGVSLALSPKFGLYGLASVLIGFITHEFAHRQFARKEGCASRFVLDPFGFSITLISTLLPIAFLAPGYVGINCWGTILSKSSMVKISAAGPATNLILAFFGFTMMYTYGHPFFYVFTIINSWLALFNLIPFGPLDGAKIMRGNPILWGFMIVLAGVLLFFI